MAASLDKFGHLFSLKKELIVVLNGSLSKQSCSEKR